MNNFNIFLEFLYLVYCRLKGLPLSYKNSYKNVFKSIYFLINS